MDFKVKFILVKDFIEREKCKKSLISITVKRRRRHSKLFNNCHASWDTLYVPIYPCIKKTIFGCQFKFKKCIFKTLF